MKFKVPIANDEKQNEEIPLQTTRRILAQVLASSAKNLLVFNFGLAITFPTILISALSGSNTEINPNEQFTITPSETTWLASITAICQPLGSILSPFLTEIFGRKRTMMFINVPYVAAWFLIYFSSNLTMIYFAFTLFGLSIGAMESCIFAFIGEICEPRMRGILTASAGIFATSAISLVYVLGNFVSWRNVAIILSTIPLFSIFCLFWIPESPLWLLSKNRVDSALKSLQWLRGWVPQHIVQDEFAELIRYEAIAHSCFNCTENQAICEHMQPTIKDRIRDLFRYKTFYPFAIVSSQFIISVFTGIAPYRPYLVQTFRYYQIPNPNEAIWWIGVTGIAANIFLLVFVRALGKRQIYLWSMATTVLLCLFLGIYGFLILPNDITSFEIADVKIVTIDTEHIDFIRYLPLIGFYTLSFVSCVGISSIPNMILAEILPLKSKAFATGISTAIYYISTFICAKTFYAMESVFSLSGLGILYAIIGTIGFIGMYRMMPETEMKTLQEIEMLFTKPKITNLKDEAKCTIQLNTINRT